MCALIESLTGANRKGRQYQSTTDEDSNRDIARQASISISVAGASRSKPLIVSPLDATQEQSTNETMNHNQKSSVRVAVNVSLLVNILLFFTKIYVYIDSFSLSVLVSLVDSIMDLLSQFVIYCTERNMTRQHPKYPVGRTRLEPTGIMTVATLMIVSTIFIIKESVQALLDDHKLEDFNYIAIGSMSSVIFLKFICWLFCRSFKGQPIALALAEDHINDVLSNCIALTAAVISFYIPSVYYIDGIGAIVISIYIIYAWYGIGKEELQKIVGVEANSEEINDIKEICHKYENNDDYTEDIELDTICAYHVGRNLLVEVMIIMPSATELKISSDVRFSLQQEIEKLSFVERAFVQVNHKHRDGNEHKVAML